MGNVRHIKTVEKIYCEYGTYSVQFSDEFTDVEKAYLEILCNM